MSTRSRTNRIGLLAAILAAGGLVSVTLNGCGTYEGGYAAYSGPVAMAPGDYIYYPGYETYYDNVSHVYVYRDHHHRWVRRPSPPHGFVRNSVSVQMNFHDTPEHHHAEVSRSYPHNWHPVRHKEKDHDDHHHRDHDRDHDHDHQ